MSTLEVILMVMIVGRAGPDQAVYLCAMAVAILTEDEPPSTRPRGWCRRRPSRCCCGVV